MLMGAGKLSSRVQGSSLGSGYMILEPLSTEHKGTLEMTAFAR